MTLIPEDPDSVPDHVVVTGTDYRRAARRQWLIAVRLADLEPEAAADAASQALQLAASALNWLEGTEHEDEVHKELHKYGTFRRENFPDRCRYFWDGQRYSRVCPVDIAHKRFGFSIGFTATRRCSVCMEDLSECPHLPGRLYEVVCESGPEEPCSVCHADGCSEHIPGERYEVRVHSVITDVDTLEEISLVSLPKQPDARLSSIPVDTHRLKEHLGSGFEPGMPVDCSKCLSPCRGFDYLTSDV